MFIFKKTFVLLNVLLFCTSLSLIQTKSLPEGDDNGQEQVDEQSLIENKEEGSGELDNTGNANGFGEGQIDDKLDMDKDGKEPEKEEDNKEIRVQEDEVDAEDEEKEDTNEEHLFNSDVDKDKSGEENVEGIFMKEDEEQVSVEQQNEKKNQVDHDIKSYEERMQELLEILNDMQKSIHDMISAKAEIVRST